jgi:hypothetical protein
MAVACTVVDIGRRIWVRVKRDLVFAVGVLPGCGVVIVFKVGVV